MPTAVLIAAGVAALTVLSGELAKLGGTAAIVAVAICAALVAFLGTLARWQEKGLPPPDDQERGGNGGSSSDGNGSDLR